MGAAIVPKMPPWHVRFGRIFFWSMTVLVLTAIPVMRVTQNVFLGLVPIFSYSFVFFGYRIARRSPGGEPTAVDCGAARFTLVASLALAVLGAVAGVRGSPFGIVCLVFAAIGITTTRSHLRFFRESAPEPRAWMVEHLSAMGGAYIAVTTAFATVNFSDSGVPIPLVWLAPSVVGIVVIGRAIRRVESGRNAQNTEMS